MADNTTEQDRIAKQLEAAKALKKSLRHLINVAEQQGWNVPTARAAIEQAREAGL